MHTWCDHNAFRRDSDDPLVSDTRILLLLQAYLPNFWRTFLHYGQDSKEQIAPSHLEFPTGAQRSEMPPGQDTTMTATKAEVPKLFVTEASMLRCAEDFGLVPTVCSAKQVAKIFRSLATSQAKIDVFPPKGDGRSSPGGGGFEAAGRASPASMRSPRSPGSVRSPRSHSKVGANKIPMMTKSASKRHMIGVEHQRQISSDFEEVEGPGLRRTYTQRKRESRRDSAGFCQFVEIVARIGYEGLDKPHFAVLYPTPMSKVAAVSIGAWGVADQEKLAAVKLLASSK